MPKRIEDNNTPTKYIVYIIGVIYGIYQLLFISGLKSCGAFNTQLLETADIAIVAVLGCLFSQFISGLQKVIGGIFLFVGYLFLSWSSSIEESKRKKIIDVDIIEKKSEWGKPMTILHNAHPLQGIILLLIAGIES